MNSFLKEAARKVLPLSLKRALKHSFEPYARWSYRKKLDKIRFILPDNSVVVNYAGVIQRRSGEIVTGGRVKLIVLDALYPEQQGRFNILYLVSSALPPYSEEYVLWAKSKGVKIVWNQNGVAYPAWAGAALQEEINGPMKEIIHQADYVFYQSRFCLESADKYLGRVSAPWEIAYNFIDTNVFRPPDNPPETEPWRLLSAGSHQRRYRVTSLLDTMTEFKRRKRKALLTIAGRLEWPDCVSPNEETVMEIKKRGLENEVILLPEFTREKAPSIYQGQHALLHTKYNDPCPTVPLEAMACGVPVVASGSGGMPELVEDGAGVLIDLPLGWEEDLSLSGLDIADAVETIMQDHAQYSAGARALAVRRFGQEVWFRRHKLIFEKLVNG